MIFVHNGKSNYHIFIDKNATESICVAAQSLQDLVKRCTGAELPIVNEEVVPYVSIGNTTAFEKLGVSVGVEELNDDGFKIVFRNGNIYLCGPKERATVYAANDFAERYLGVRFLTVEEMYTPFSETVEIEEKDVVEIPDFRSRCFYTLNVKRPRFASQMRLISQYAPDEESQKYGGGFLRDWNSYTMHALNEILPKAKYQEQHPEWFVDKGPRSWFCLTNGLTEDDEDANDPNSCLSTFADNVIEIIKNNPTKTYFMLGHEDSCGNVRCDCERCKRSLERNLNIAGQLMVWTNAIARRVEKWRLENRPTQDVKIVQFSYLDTVIPPVLVENEDGRNKPYIFLEREFWAPLKVRKGKIVPVNSKVIPEKNVVIFCAPLGMCYLHEFTDEKCDWNQYFDFSLKAWASLGAKCMVWHYGVNFKCHLWWFPNRRTLRSNYQEFKKANLLFLMQQGAPGEGGFYQVLLNTYLNSKLMWNCSLDTDELTREFNRLYFGEKAGKAVDEFIEKIENCFEGLKVKYNDDYHSDIQNHFPNSFVADNFPYEFLVDCIEGLEKAKEEAEDESVKTKLKRVLVHPLYMLLYNFKNYENANPKYLDMLEQYLIDAGLRSLSEGAQSPAQLIKQFKEAL